MELENAKSVSNGVVSNAKSKIKKLDPEVERDVWDNHCDFLLSCIGYAVGLGNVWRFPYLCYEHGGGSFLVAYFVMLILCGLPLFFLELALGQYARMGPSTLFGQIAPAFKGVGYGMLITSTMIMLYYNMIIAWTLFYTFAGFTSNLPWEFCGNDFNSVTCYTHQQGSMCVLNSEGLENYYNGTCVPVKEICAKYNLLAANETLVDKHNSSMCSNGTNSISLFNVYKRVSASEDYFNRHLLGIKADTDWYNVGQIRWQIVLCLAGAWIIVCLCLIKGVKSSGKIVYFTALFPYVILILLLIRGVTLDGAHEGIMFYLTPKWSKLLETQIWSDAATQIFFSLSLSLGGLQTLSSYNRFNNNCHKDAILIALINCGTSIFAGFVIFSIVGFMAHELDQEIKDVIKSGTGLAFIAYPEVVTKMPFSPLWSFLFFIMLLTLGLDSQFTFVETLSTAILDLFPILRKNKALVAITVSVFGFTLGLSMCTNGGIFMFELLNEFSASWSLIMLAIIEIIVVMYVYGYEKFKANIQEMGIRIPVFLQWYWRVCWQFISPIILTTIMVSTWINFTPCSFGDYVFETPFQIMGWIIASTSVVIIPLAACYEYLKTMKKCKDKSIKSMFSPTSQWSSTAYLVKQLDKDNFNENIANTEHAQKA